MSFSLGPVMSFFFLPLHNQAYRGSAAAENLSKVVLYDVPKPAKPVEGPYSPSPEDASQAFPAPPPVTLTEGEGQQGSEESNC